MSRSTFSDREYYRKQYEGESDPWSRMTWLDQRTEDWMQKYRDLTPSPCRMLDLGCGRGRITEQFTGMGCFTLGVDYLYHPLRSGSSGHKGNGSRFLQADALDLPLVENSFTVLVDYGFLHHVRRNRLSRYRRTINHQLRKRGMYFVCVFALEDQHAERGDRDWIYHRGHYDRFFSLRDLREVAGPNFSLLEHELERDGEHAFHHALFQKST